MCKELGAFFILFFIFYFYFLFFIYLFFNFLVNMYSEWLAVVVPGLIHRTSNVQKILTLTWGTPTLFNTVPRFFERSCKSTFHNQFCDRQTLCCCFLYSKL